MRKAMTLFIILILAQPVYAESWFQRLFGRSSETPRQGEAWKQAPASFTKEDRQKIADYFKDKTQESEKMSKGKGKSKEMPPGLAKKESLPPGLQKQLEKNGTLPPGLAKRDLPYDLERQLSSIAKGHKRVIVDRDVVLMEETTGLILDVIRDVVIGM